MVVRAEPPPAGARWAHGRLSSDRGRALAPRAALAVLLALGAAIVVRESHGFSFFQDEWGFLVDRRAWSVENLLRPEGPQLFVVPVIVFKLLLSVFGASSYRPFIVLAALDMVILAGAVGIVSRWRWGSWWGLVPVAVMVTLGPGARTLLWPFQVTSVLATAAGILALLWIEHGTRRGDVLACVALVVALGSAAQGVGLLAGAGVMLLLSERRFARAWVIAIPAGLYLIWYAAYSPASQTQLSLWPHIPDWVLHAFGATVGAMLGLAGATDGGATVDTTLGIPVGIVLLVLTAVAIARGLRFHRRLAVGAAVALLVLWITAALSNTAGQRPPNTQRYTAADVAIMFVAVCAIVPRPRLGRRAAAVALVVVAAICVRNVTEFSVERPHFLGAAVASRAELGVLLIARGVVEAGFQPPAGAPAALEPYPVSDYFAMVDADGTNAYPAATIATLGPDLLLHVDSLLIHAERVALGSAAGAHVAASPPQLTIGRARARGACLTLSAAPVKLTVPAAGVTIKASPRQLATVRAERFGHRSIAIGEVRARGLARFAPARDGAPGFPWRLLVRGDGAQVCALAA